MFIGGVFFNFIGGSIRYVYGSIWRSVARKKKYTFHEYLYGPNDSDEIEDSLGHEIINRIIGFIFVILILFYTTGIISFDI